MYQNGKFRGSYRSRTSTTQAGDARTNAIGANTAPGRFIISDYEATGLSPAYDQPVQFAGGLFTGTSSLKMEDSINIRSRIDPYVIPSPEALSVIGINPFMLDEQGFSSLEFAQKVHDFQANQENFVSIGYNNLEYDEKMQRHALYRNLLPPYVTSRRGCGRSDLRPIVELLASIRPDSLNVPLNDKGRRSFRLEPLCMANGIAGFQAHDAMGDIHGTGQLASLVMQRAPDLWQMVMDLSFTPRAEAILDGCMMSREPLYFFSHYGEARWQIMYPAGKGKSKRDYILIDIAGLDIEGMISLDAGDLAKFMDENFKHIKILASNSSPMVFTRDQVAKLGVPGSDLPAMPEGSSALCSKLAGPDFQARFRQANAIRQLHLQAKFGPSNPGEKRPVEERLYDGFTDRMEEKLLKDFRRGNWQEKAALIPALTDERNRLLAMRILHAHAPETLPEKVRFRMDLGLAGRLLDTAERPWRTIASARKELEALREKDDANQELVRDIGRWLDRKESFTIQMRLEAERYLSPMSNPPAPQIP